MVADESRSNASHKIRRAFKYSEIAIANAITFHHELTGL